MGEMQFLSFQSPVRHDIRPLQPNGNGAVTVTQLIHFLLRALTVQGHIGDFMAYKYEQEMALCSSSFEYLLHGTVPGEPVTF
jgi:hypothetical protein